VLTSRIHSLGLVLLGCLGCTADPVAAPLPACEPTAATGIQITNRDVYGAAPYAFGYPPYAADGCSLLYVAPSADANGNGELRLRDLATGEETVIAAASTLPRRPVLAGDWMAWEADVQGRTLIHVRNRNEESPIVLDVADHATEPRISATAVVFTAWLGPETTANTDIATYDFATGTIELIGQGPGQQRFGDISETHVAWTDFSEDPDGQFNEDPLDVADIVVFDRQTKTMSTRPRVGKQAFPMLGATGKLGFLDWNLVHPEPKLIAYDLRLADIDAPLTDSVLVEAVETVAPYIRPAAHGAYLEWFDLVENVGLAFWRMRADTTSAPVLVQEASAVQRFAPIASDEMTFIGVRNMDGTVAIEAFAR
jgi:hypothetical protein